MGVWEKYENVSVHGCLWVFMCVTMGICSTSEKSRLWKMQHFHTHSAQTTRFGLLYRNILVHSSNFYLKIIFSVLTAKITVHTGNYPSSFFSM